MSFFIFPTSVQSIYMKVIYLGAGGFWVAEAVYQQMKGVTEVIPGYMGGTIENPSHEAVATGTTGHVEVVKVVYDETAVNIEDILNVFFAMHDASAPNHSGNGIGSQYRSVIFYTEDNEGEATDEGNGSDVGIIHQSMEKVQTGLPGGIPVATQAMTATQFYPAEESHYRFYEQNPHSAYAETIIVPKLQELKRRFFHLFL
jgi:peptide-methionine (S)-S-oxide reductase